MPVVLQNVSLPSNHSSGSGNNTKLSLELLERIRQVAKVTKVVTPVTIAVLLVIGLIGNVLVISITLKTKRVAKHPVLSILVLNLAVADLIYLLASAPYQAISQSVSEWIYGDFLCPVLHFLNIQTMAVSIITMSSLAVMRFIGLVMPFEIQRSFISTSKKLVGCIIVGISWLLASVIALPNLVYFRVRLIEEATGTAEDCAWEDKDADRINSIILLIFTYIIPFILVTVLYSIIAKKIHIGMASSQDRDRSEYIKMTIIVFCLIIAFLICWFPHHLQTMILASRNYSAFSYAIMKHVIDVLGYCFAYAHACVNPIIYTFATPNFRKRLRNICGRSSCRCACQNFEKRKENNLSRSPRSLKKKKQSMLVPERTLTTKLASPIMEHNGNEQTDLLQKLNPTSNNNI